MAEDAGTQAGGSNEVDLAVLTQAVAAAQKKLEELHDLQKAARVQLLLVVCVIVAIMLVFGFKTYNTVKANFAAERMQKVAEDRLPPLMQQGSRMLIAAVQDAAPTYQAVAAERFNAMLPKLRTEAEKQFDELPAKIHDDLMKQLDASATRVTNEILASAKGTFPSLTDAGAVNVLDHFQEALERESTKFRDHALGLIGIEQERLEKVFASFDVRDVAGKDLHDLELQFVHELIRLVDYKLTAIKAGE